MANKKYNFGEKKEEFSPKDGENLEVTISPKYLATRKKVIEMLESEKYKNVLSESDFWILMNRTKNNKMMYTGLIISHNGCLKINDVLEEKMKFKARCVQREVEEYKKELLYTYINEEQGIYEVGEVSVDNCKNEYPHAMAFKRLFDRVVLKNSKLAYAGVYSDSEADEFVERQENANNISPYDFEKENLMTEEQTKIIVSLDVELKEHLRKVYKKDPIKLTKVEADNAIKSLKKNGLIKSKKEIEIEKKENEEVF